MAIYACLFQIEIVVDHLLKKDIAARVLVIIPNCYLNDNIRNSITRNMKSFERKTKEDEVTPVLSIKCSEFPCNTIKIVY